MKRLLAVLLLSLMPNVALAGTGEFIVFYTAYTDVDRLAKMALERCQVIAPDTVPGITQQYGAWREVHRPYQAPLQKMIKELLRNAPDMYRAVSTKEGRADYEKNMVPENIDVEACRKMSVNFLGDMPIAFKNYVEEKRFGRLQLVQ